MTFYEGLIKYNIQFINAKKKQCVTYMKKYRDSYFSDEKTGLKRDITEIITLC